jgi:hypothetical protein
MFLEVIDPPGPLGLLVHQSGTLQETQMAGDGRAADGHGRGDLLDRFVSMTEQPEDFAPVGVAQRFERISVGGRPAY